MWYETRQQYHTIPQHIPPISIYLKVSERPTPRPGLTTRSWVNRFVSVVVVWPSALSWLLDDWTSRAPCQWHCPWHGGGRSDDAGTTVREPVARWGVDRPCAVHISHWTINTQDAADCVRCCSGLEGAVSAVPDGRLPLIPLPPTTGSFDRPTSVSTTGFQVYVSAHSLLLDRVCGTT